MGESRGCFGIWVQGAVMGGEAVMGFREGIGGVLGLFWDTMGL